MTGVVDSSAAGGVVRIAGEGDAAGVALMATGGVALGLDAVPAVWLMTVVEEGLVWIVIDGLPIKAER